MTAECASAPSRVVAACTAAALAGTFAPSIYAQEANSSLHVDDVPVVNPAPPKPPPPSLASGATPRNQARWYRQFRYPKDADFLGEEGTTRFWLTIGTNGRVTDCAVTGSSGFSNLDKATCLAARRYARFNPARDDAGNPTIGTFSNRVVWRHSTDAEYNAANLGWAYPKAARKAGQQGRVGAEFRIGPDGTVSKCMITISSGSWVLDKATCDNIKKMKGSYAAPKANGTYQVRTMRRTVFWQLSRE